jgi:hypothetical protein
VAIGVHEVMDGQKPQKQILIRTTQNLSGGPPKSIRTQEDQLTALQHWFEDGTITKAFILIL